MTPTMSRLLEQGWLAPLDAAFSEALGRLSGEKEELALLGAAVARAFSGRGHVCADLASLGGTPVIGWEGEPLAAGNWPGVGEWRDAILSSALVSHAGEAAPLAVFGDRLYLHKLAAMEARVAGEIERRASRVPAFLDEASLRAGLDREFGELASAPESGQRLAVRRAIERSLCVITGGPGTGKTTILARCLSVLVEQAQRTRGRPPRIALAAPTGKAAARMAAAIGACKRGETPVPLRVPPEVADAIPTTASTLHRLLGYGSRAGSRFAFDGSRKLPVDAIVVDEASMVGIELMDALLAAAPESARVILVGDRNQLASVQAGAVLGDICGLDAPWVVALDRSFRFSGALGDFSRAVNAGDARSALEIAAGGRDEIALAQPREERAALEAAVARGVALFEAIAREPVATRRIGLLETSGILCAHRNGPLGSLHLNREVERRLAARGAKSSSPWYDGRPVMALRNDPRLGVFNGDLGVVCRGAESGGFEVCFAGDDGSVRRVEPGRLGDHETAFAVTVHKAQGSEFDEVLAVLPEAPSPVTTRELLYTAATRARRRVEILGAPEVVASAIAAPTVRFSGLTERLRRGADSTAS